MSTGVRENFLLFENFQIELQVERNQQLGIKLRAIVAIAYAINDGSIDAYPAGDLRDTVAGCVCCKNRIANALKVVLVKVFRTC